jgi:hypothetical protein
MKKPKNLGFEPVQPKNVLLASVVHGISCLFSIFSKLFVQIKLKILKFRQTGILSKFQAGYSFSNLAR